MKAKILVYVLPVLILAAVHLAEAQQPNKGPLIGFLGGNSSSNLLPRVEGFKQGMRELGYVEGQNVTTNTDSRTARSKAT